MFFYLIVLFFFIKQRVENNQTHLIEQVLQPICQEYSKYVLDELSHTLRKDLRLVINSNTTSIFRYNINLRGLQSVKRVSNKLVFEPFKISSALHLFVDKESLICYSDLQDNGMDVMYYEYPLTSGLGHKYLIDAYKNLLGLSFENIKYFEFNLKTTDCKFYEERILEHSGIGRIHNTNYKQENVSMNILKEHFEKFFTNSGLINLPMYVIAKEYINSLAALLIQKKVLKRATNIEPLLSYKISKNLADKFLDEIFITGGLCFDKLTQQDQQNFDLTNFCKSGDRFIFTYFFTIENGKIVFEQIK